MQLTGIYVRRRGTGFALILTLCLAHGAHAGDRLLATDGLMSIEGSAGGGLTPWAVIAGLGTDEQVGASAFCTELKPRDFELQSCGIAAGIENRLELSIDRQRFDLSSVVPGQDIDQTIVGAKIRLYGDLVGDQDRLWPQVAVGAQWKDNTSFDLVPKALGARHASGLDLYLAGTKLWLDGPFGRSWVADVTIRYSEANQLGLLGFGGDIGTYQWLPEGSLGLFITDCLIAGVEYREKPNNLSALREDDARDAFLAYLPVKWLSLTLAYVDLGQVAAKAGQTGPYLSLQGSY
jgi:hypothetical protein